ncbi:MAG: glycerol-3-phosphate dehydrogenase/oxidase [Armatimonadetes bacterium]|nr:glycerol-3-phosphate dehydrogenase/oxidase [Armatimonadota bacterium]
MQSFSQRDRLAALERMAGDGVDVLVIGGGITGASVALDAAARGYRVGLVEKADFAGGTSSKSTKLIHGGLRYLPQLDFGLVREALVERGLLFRNAPWLVRPLGFVLPLYAWNRRPLGTPIAPPGGLGLDWVVQTGLLLYDLFAGRLNPQRHRRLTLAEAERRAPALRRPGLRHAFLYYDGQTDDARLTLAVLRTAARHGVRAANYAEVTGFDIAGTRIRAAHVRDRLTQQEYTIRARHVVNAGGIFAQHIEELTGLPSQLAIAPAKGVHLVFSSEKIPMTSDAVVLPETDDGRLLFLLPWERRVVVGTTDTEGGDVDRPRTTAEDVTYLLDHCNRYLNVNLTPEDVISTYAGFRPLIQSRSADRVTSARLSRSHAVLDGPAGMVSVVGGKLTTARRMAEDAMNHVARHDGRLPSSVTRSLPLDGAAGWPLVRRVIERHSLGLDGEVRAHLGAAYGADLRQVLAVADEDKRFARRIVPGLPYLMAEVPYACRHEMALTLDDVLTRRTRLVLEDRRQGATVVGEVADIMAAELGWDAAETARQVQAYLANISEEYRPTRSCGETPSPPSETPAR